MGHAQIGQIGRLVIRSIMVDMGDLPLEDRVKLVVEMMTKATTSAALHEDLSFCCSWEFFPLFLGFVAHYLPPQKFAKVLALDSEDDNILAPDGGLIQPGIPYSCRPSAPTIPTCRPPL